MVALIEGTKKRGCLRAGWTDGVKEITLMALPEVAGDWLDGVETEYQEGHHTSAETYQKRKEESKCQHNNNNMFLFLFSSIRFTLLYFSRRRQFWR